MSSAFHLHLTPFARRALVLAAMLVFLMCTMACAEEEAATQTPGEAVEASGEEAAEEEPLVYSRIVNIPGLGEMQYYAQNDPAWSEMVYESKNSEKRNRMRGAACGPTSLAMAIARQVPEADLPVLLAEAKKQEFGFRFCECSVVKEYHSGDHEFIDPRTPEDFAKYLPVIFASYATGNNIHYRQYRFSGSGTNNSLFQTMSGVYGLTYRSTRDWEVAREALEDGYSVITTVTKGIFTGTSHYLYIAGVADGYVYILDSLMRTEYPNDRKHRLEVVEPGVVRAPVDEVAGLQLYGYYMMKAE